MWALIAFLVVLVAILIPLLLWARSIEKRIEPPRKHGHEEGRFRFKYGGEPPTF